MKRYIALLLALVMVFTTAVGCSKGSGESDTSAKSETKQVADDTTKVGFILPAESDAPDTEAREDAIRDMQKNTGLTDSQVIIAENVSKEDCAAQIDTMKKDKCQLIFACGSRYEEAVMEAAKKYEDIQFCVEDGRDTIDCGLSNVHTYNSSIYEAYYVGGIIAGMKMNDMLNSGDITSEDCRIGFVAYKQNAETTTCINAFYLGVKKVCSQCTVDVRYVKKRGNYDADGEAAKQLAESGVGFMATYIYTTAAAAVCAEYGIPLIGNEENEINVAPKKALASVYTDWSIYYTDAVNALLNGKEIDNDWCGGYKSGVVRLTQLNDAHVSNGTADKVMEVEKKLREGKTKIFKTEDFTINGTSLETLIKDDTTFKKKYKEYVSDGQLKEQSKISAPVFEDFIDGISVSTENYISTDTESSEATTESE